MHLDLDLDLANSCSTCSDAKFYKHVTQPLDVNLLQCALNAPQNWCQKLLLSLNIKRCKVISYGGTVDKTHTYNVLDCNNQMNPLEKNKDLGIWFDEKLSFEEQH